MRLTSMVERYVRLDRAVVDRLEGDARSRRELQPRRPEAGGGGRLMAHLQPL